MDHRIRSAIVIVFVIFCHFRAPSLLGGTTANFPVLVFDSWLFTRAGLGKNWACSDCYVDSGDFKLKHKLYPYVLGSGNVALALCAREPSYVACYVPRGWRISGSRARRARAGRVDSLSVESAHVSRGDIGAVRFIGPPHFAFLQYLICMGDVARWQIGRLQ